MYVDPSKTIATPYRQGNELVFEQNVGQLNLMQLAVFSAK